MKVRGSIARVASISNVAKDVPRVDQISRLESAVSIEVRIVMNLSSGPEDVDDLSSELVGSDADYYSIRCAEYRRSAWCKDVNALM